MGSLLLVPEGGLANRMRAIGSAYNLCRNVGSKLQVIWFQSWGMRAPFSALFKSVDDNVMQICEANLLDNLLYQTPRRHNLWLPRLPQRLMFQHRIYAKDVTALKHTEFDFISWCKGRKCYISCYQEIAPIDNLLYIKLFKPKDNIMGKVAAFMGSFPVTTIGMHIRRTDNIISREKSPLELFINKGKEELSQGHSEMKIFLATDGEDVKREMISTFGSDRIITSSSAASRDSIEGISDGIADMYTLAHCKKIYGSAGSTFSEMAATLAGGKAQYECLSV